MSVDMSDILELSVPERIQLVGDIWDSIALVPDEVTLTNEQKAELDRRLDDYRASPGGNISWTEVKADVLKRL